MRTFRIFGDVNESTSQINGATKYIGFEIEVQTSFGLEMLDSNLNTRGQTKSTKDKGSAETKLRP